MPISVLAFGLPQGAEWIIILIIALLIFGPKLPSIMRGLGGSIKEFKRGAAGEDTPARPEYQRTEAPVTRQEPVQAPVSSQAPAQVTSNQPPTQPR